MPPEDLEIVEIQSAPAYFPSQGNVKYHVVESSVASLANPHSTKGYFSRLSRKRRPKTQKQRPLENEDLENEDPLENKDLENEDPLDNEDALDNESSL